MLIHDEMHCWSGADRHVGADQLQRWAWDWAYRGVRRRCDDATLLVKLASGRGCDAYVLEFVVGESRTSYS